MNEGAPKKLQGDFEALQVVARGLRDQIRAALQFYEKRSILAEQIQISESDLSRLTNGGLENFCRLLAALNFTLCRRDYLEAMTLILKEKL